MAVAPLSPGMLRRPGLSPDAAFETTDDLPDLEGPLGQDRAVAALRFAIAMPGPGWGAYVMGPPGSGRHALVLRMLERAAAEAETPSDCCYLNDFAEPRRPRAVELPPGRALALRADMDRLVAELRVAIPAAFESADHRARLQLLDHELEEARERAVDEVRQRANARGIALLRTPIGFGFAPVKDGEVIEPDAFHELPEEVQERVKRDITQLQADLQRTLRSMPDLERRHREKVKEANREVALHAAGHLLDELQRRYADLPAVLAHLDAVQLDVLENVHEFLAGADGDSDLPAQLRKLLADTPALQRYGVNVMIDHSGHTGAPVVQEDLPTLANLAGRIEHHAHFGALVTDFTLIRPGALHRARGGWLVLDARKVLAQPFAWDELKRALRSRELRIEPPERLLGIGGTSSLEPQPIPLEVQVVLVGDRFLHHLLSVLDPEFPELFKVVADLEDAIPRTAANDLDFARLVATIARRARLRPLAREAVERVLQEASRLAGDATRLTADVASVSDVVVEADHEADAAGRSVVAARDVTAALAARERRAGRLRDELQEEIRRGTLVVETSGARVGQVNGLSVVGIGGRWFGRPSRITARVRLGRGEVVDIEREVALGGPIHSKGVLILAGFLGGRYSADRPLTLAASIVFEQSYSGVEGDSASSAELYALLSAIAGVPVRQGLAVTGSVDQLGRVQAVGAVTEKVEGFFDVCRARGLDGTQGVLLPAANVPHLVLREDVLAALQEGTFRIWPVETIDEGLELLTGLPAGAPDDAGRFPAGTVNGRVAARLEALSEQARRFMIAPVAPVAEGGGRGDG
ncbi:Lon protease family protein [Anaeromyxobacter oryzae]|uniref:endopeptidase La n=1 Tax=Anaeromyxobacter oryzae TaxID=2918170 RepID=A0ABN6MR86_9BACT|nr:ATP-binding protein [Anaeromyxobacter oryzae]BDG02204.1 ATP-dependent protease [Anaeromyxobacter oryzae]